MSPSYYFHVSVIRPTLFELDTKINCIPNITVNSYFQVEIIPCKF